MLVRRTSKPGMALASMPPVSNCRVSWLMMLSIRRRTRAFDQSGKQMKRIGPDSSVKTQFRRFAQQFFSQGQSQNFGIAEGRFRAGRVIRKNLAIVLVGVVHHDKNSREEGLGIEYDGSSMNHKPICDNGSFDTKSSCLVQKYVHNNWHNA